MPRPQRHAPAGVTNHVIQRGNNRQLCFLSETDFRTYLYWLAHYAAEYHVDIHAWVLMPNHVHLMCTPQTTDALSKLMQSLGRKYVRYFNFTHQRTGTLWEGRFKSWPVLTNDYLWQLFRYIELNPVRAGITSNALDYPWSSHRFNAFGTPCNLGAPHTLFLASPTPANVSIRNTGIYSHWDSVMQSLI